MFKDTVQNSDESKETEHLEGVHGLQANLNSSALMSHGSADES